MDIFSGHLLCPIFQSTLHDTLVRLKPIIAYNSEQVILFYHSFGISQYRSVQTQTRGYTLSIVTVVSHYGKIHEYYDNHSYQSSNLTEKTSTTVAEYLQQFKPFCQTTLFLHKNRHQKNKNNVHLLPNVNWFNR